MTETTDGAGTGDEPPTTMSLADVAAGGWSPEILAEWAEAVERQRAGLPWVSWTMYGNADAPLPTEGATDD